MSKVIPQLVRYFDFEVVPNEENKGKLYDYHTLWFTKQNLRCIVHERKA